MRVSRRLLMLAAFCAALLGDAPSRATEPTEFEPLRGAWVVTAAEQSGKPFDAIKGGKLTVDGEKFDLVTASGNHLLGSLHLDTTAKPQQIDFVLSGGEVWLGIYSVSATTLRLNYVEQEGDAKRPDVFATSADTPGTVIVLKKS